MKACLSDFPALNPSSLREALLGLNGPGPVVPLAGGTDLMVSLEAGSLSPCTFLNLREVREFQPSHRLGPHTLQLGPLCTYRDVRSDPRIGRLFPLLGRSAREVGGLAVQSRGTWIGNVVNASPVADGVPALMAYDAQVELTSLAATRRVPLCGFYTGYKKTLREVDELVTAIYISRPDRAWKEYFRKVGTRRFQSISKTLLAGRMRLSSDGGVEDVRIVLAGVAPFTLRAVHTEAVLRGQVLSPALIREASTTIENEIQPIDDFRSSAAYRRRVSSNLLHDFLVPGAGSKAGIKE